MCLSCEDEFHLPADKSFFSHERFCTRPHFEKEAQDNSELAYLPEIWPLSNQENWQ